MSDRLTALLGFLKQDPADAFNLYAVGLEYVALQNFTEAEKYFQKLLELNAGYVPGYMQYALLKEKLNDITGAKELYRRGIKIANETGDKKSAAEMEDFLNELE